MNTALIALTATFAALGALGAAWALKQLGSIAKDNW